MEEGTALYDLLCEKAKVGKALNGRIQKKKKRKRRSSQCSVHYTTSSTIRTGGTVNYHDKIVALDCEMVGVAPSLKSALGRCSIIDYHGNVIWDQYVLPSQPIVDYRTRWSGIRRCHMTNAIPEDDALMMIQQQLRGKIVLGHDLKHDFAVLHYAHPPSLVRDTSRYIPLRTMATLPTEHPPGLKKLALNLLNRTIQTGAHDSVEDARTCLDLYKTIEEQWEKEMVVDDTLLLTDKYWPTKLQ